MATKTAKNIELQGISTSHTNGESKKNDEGCWENKNGVARRDTIDSLVVKIAFDQDAVKDAAKIDRSNKALEWIKKIILVLICIAVAGGFSVPIVIYFVAGDRSIDSATVTINLDVDNCPSNTNYSVQVS